MNITSKIYFENFIERAYSDYLANATDEYYLRVLCLFLEGMADFYCVEQTLQKEVLEKEIKKSVRDFKEKLSNQNPNYNTVQAIAYTTKHSKSKIFPSMATVSAGGLSLQGSVNIYTAPAVNIENKEDFYFEDSEEFFLKDSNGKYYSAGMAVKQIYQYWKQKIG